MLGDKHGNLVHLNERECSIQRRNQKVIEEAPSPFLDDATRQAMGAQAIALSRAVDYDSAGTVEFIVDADRNFYFLEMNTRLQVEHPVTELTTGVDLVEQMLRVAAGETLALKQKDLAPRGWAVESRVYAEDPYRGFLPSIGRLVRYRAPDEGEHDGVVVRNDAGVREGDEISMFYDPMIAKLCAHAETRKGAIGGMAAALDGFVIEGVEHNLPFLSAVMDQDRFGEGRLTTGYIAEEFPDGFHGLPPTPWQLDLITAAACWMHRLQTSRRANGGKLRDDWIVVTGADKRRVRLSLAERSLEIEYLDEGRVLRLTGVDWRPGQPLLRAALDGVRFTVKAAPAAEGFDIRHRAATARVLVLNPRSAELHEKLPARAPADTSKLIVSPMPGLVISIAVEAGQAVKAGETVAVVEAMKMQNIIRAERDGVVKSVGANPGDSIAADEVLIELA